MNLRRCGECENEYGDEAGKPLNQCPNCDSTFFSLVSLKVVPKTPPPVSAKSDQVVPRKSLLAIEEEKRVKLDGSIYPEILKKFKIRLQLELEEIAYQEWRAMQPEWKIEVARAASNPKSQENIGGFVGSQLGATALGVFVGTTAIRAQLNEINENQDAISGGDSGDTVGGIFDSLGDLFS